MSCSEDDVESLQDEMCVQLGRILCAYPKEFKRIAQLARSSGSEKKMDELYDICSSFYVSARPELSKEDSWLITNFIRGVGYFHGAEL